ncbi:hypothetical protein WNY78_11640 [Psychroserpens sp. AS72]|uniref:hypothetical protein n=1 Tax=Psychroserpens sp. AS72 TaxID=3135775 RepID=UPI00316D2840
MKKIVFLFMMSLTFSAFSSNSISNKLDFNFTKIDNKTFTTIEDNGWGVTCYITIVNQVTGEERKVFSSGTGATPGLALLDCEKNAREKAKREFFIVE